MSVDTVEQGATVGGFLTVQKKYRGCRAYVHFNDIHLRLASATLAKTLGEDVRSNPLEAEHPMVWSLNIAAGNDRSDKKNFWFSVSTAPDNAVVAFLQRWRADYQARRAAREAVKSAEAA